MVIKIEVTQVAKLNYVDNRLFLFLKIVNLFSWWITKTLVRSTVTMKIVVNTATVTTVVNISSKYIW
jgi:hypothetical protein